ncbi:MAG TPA: hypothetical protein VK279_13485 [Solirubrobacteraceae bacterium]|nr:hypothetical protein [Solirubrobacteraceae bacterium]
MAAGLRDLAAVQTGDLAVGPVGREHAVDPPQPFEHLLDARRADGDVADVDEYRHAHHLLDPADHGRPARLSAERAERS